MLPFFFPNTQNAKFIKKTKNAPLPTIQLPKKQLLTLSCFFPSPSTTTLSAKKQIITYHIETFSTISKNTYNKTYTKLVQANKNKITKLIYFLATPTSRLLFFSLLYLLLNIFCLLLF